MPPKPNDASVLAALEAELLTIPEALRASAPAAMCRHLAGVMAATTDPREVAAVSRELRAALGELREAVARAGKRGDAIDEIGARRAARRSAAAEAAGNA